jgi:hypothetical protein
LLLTSTLYFQLGSGSGLDFIKYPTCSNTCSLGASVQSTLNLTTYYTQTSVNHDSAINDGSRNSQRGV